MNPGRARIVVSAKLHDLAYDRGSTIPLILGFFLIALQDEQIGASVRSSGDLRRDGRSVARDQPRRQLVTELALSSVERVVTDLSSVRS
jgi:hypothetical protein